MSINPYSSGAWLSDCSSGRLNLNEEEGAAVAAAEEEKEAMFEKALTPSDVGKLNRLVIPKQHAEKHFPMDMNSNSNSNSKGFLLSFEDESGKCWRFRYSYWNSSQSYVLTKGWSRYVKDKRLNAGDVVFFHRHRLHPHRFFISSKHPPFHAPTGTGGGGSQLQGQSSGSGKVLRLFGVNMECQPHNHSTHTQPTLTHQTLAPYSPSNTHPHPHPHMLHQQPY
ncbi:hypothetical protein Fmac_006547 [Flemingia macrophylla]|uniref:TF-B3 domain-containing protein n=1 Tax=Flemingia macrophylla TaxID=520843 RepID=A0ABD1NAX5_9FABA